MTLTLEQYARIIGNRLVTAHNDKDGFALAATFEEADRELENSNISPADRKRFWEEVRGVVDSGPLLLEKQANSALLALMQAIQREIAARTGTSK
jgi:hypothetical protein